MAAELPPPAYEEVVASAPLPGVYNRLSRQDSLPQEAKRRLIQEVTSLREQTLGQMSILRNLTADIDRAYTLLKNNRSNIEREMYEWRVHLTSLIDEIYQVNMGKVSESFDTLEHKLVINREKVFGTYESARKLCWSMDEQVSLRNHHTAQFMKRRFTDKLEEIQAIQHEEIVPDRSIAAWRFIKPEVNEEQVRDLAGKVSQLVVPSEVTNSGASDHRNTDVNRGMRPNTGAQDTHTDDLPTFEQAITDSATNESTRGTFSSAAPGSDLVDQKYTLLHTIQTKTFKDKARCHPISFAVDFDGNVIVADKFNQKLKIFTQRGQLIREIFHPLLRSPTYITLTLAGDIAVSDTESADVKFFSNDGVLLGNVPNLPNPGGLTFNLMGELLVTDTNQKAVHIVDTQLGSIKSSIQYYTAADNARYNYFQWPHYVTTGHNDEIMVTDRAAGNYRIFTSKGNYMGKIGTHGSGEGQFQDPYGISSYMGHGVIVADYSNNRIQHVDADGRFKEPLLTSEDGLRFPTCASCTTDEKVLVSQYLTGEIKIFSHRLEHLESEEALPPSYTEVVSEQSTSASGGGVGSRDPRATQVYDDYQQFGPGVSAARTLTRTPSWETSI